MKNSIGGAAFGAEYLDGVGQACVGGYNPPGPPNMDIMPDDSAILERFGLQVVGRLH